MYSVLTAIFQVNLGQPVPVEAKEHGGCGDNCTTGAINRAKLQSNHHHQQTNIRFLRETQSIERISYGNVAGCLSQPVLYQND